MRWGAKRGGFTIPIVGRFLRETEGFLKISLSGVGRSRQTDDSRLNQREPRQEGATKGSVAPGSAPKVSPKAACRRRRSASRPRGLPRSQAFSPRDRGLFKISLSGAGRSPARRARLCRAPELLRCEGDDKYGWARPCRAYPPIFVIPFSAPSVLFQKLFRRGEKAPLAADSINLIRFN